MKAQVMFIKLNCYLFDRLYVK